MTRYKLNEAHMIECEKLASGVRVHFYEWYTVCGWRKLFSEDYVDLDTVKWDYGLEE